MSARFWLAVLRFAYRRLREPVTRLPDGVPGIRDVDAPCSAYSPRVRERYEAECRGDGHYLCAECALLAPPGDEEQEREEMNSRG